MSKAQKPIATFAFHSKGTASIAVSSKTAANLFACANALDMTIEKFVEKIAKASDKFCHSTGNDPIKHLQWERLKQVSEEEDAEFNDPACTLPAFENTKDFLLHLLLHAVKIKRTLPYYPSIGIDFDLWALYDQYQTFHSSELRWVKLPVEEAKAYEEQFAYLVSVYGETSNPLIRIKTQGLKEGDKLLSYVVEFK